MDDGYKFSSSQLTCYSLDLVNNDESVLRSWRHICPWGAISSGTETWSVKRGGIMFTTKTKTPVCLRVSFSFWNSNTPSFQGTDALTDITSGFIIFPSLSWREMTVILSFPDQCHLISTYCQPRKPRTVFCFFQHRFLLQVSLIYSSMHYQLPSFVMANPASLAGV